MIARVAQLRGARAALLGRARRRGRTIAIAVLIGIACPATARAEWFITPFLGIKFAGSTRIVDLEQGARNVKFTLGAIASSIGDGVFGVEADVGYTPRFFERSGSNILVVRSHVLTVMGNVVVTTPRELTGDSLRPFISGGAGLMQSGIDDVVDVFGVDSRQFAINVGGGATGRLTDLTSVRFELRYFKSISNADEDNVGFGSTSLSFWRAGVGLAFRY